MTNTLKCCLHSATPTPSPAQARGENSDNHALPQIHHPAKPRATKLPFSTATSHRNHHLTQKHPSITPSPSSQEVSKSPKADLKPSQCPLNDKNPEALAQLTGKPKPRGTRQGKAKCKRIPSHALIRSNVLFRLLHIHTHTRSTQEKPSSSSKNSHQSSNGWSRYIGTSRHSDAPPLSLSHYGNQQTNGKSIGLVLRVPSGNVYPHPCPSAEKRACLPCARAQRTALFCSRSRPARALSSLLHNVEANELWQIRYYDALLG
jgi:hypothetical protein